jgi:hypothetical protein
MKITVFAVGLTLFSAQASSNAAHDQIAALSEPQRAALFSKLLAKEDAACANVSRTFYRGFDKSGNAYWSAQCRSNKAYQVQISPNASGSTSLLDCAVAKIMGINCFAKFQ